MKCALCKSDTMVSKTIPVHDQITRRIRKCLNCNDISRTIELSENIPPSDVPNADATLSMVRDKSLEILQIIQLHYSPTSPPTP